MALHFVKPRLQRISPFVGVVVCLLGCCCCFLLLLGGCWGLLGAHSWPTARSGQCEVRFVWGGPERAGQSLSKRSWSWVREYRTKKDLWLAVIYCCPLTRTWGHRSEKREKDEFSANFEKIWKRKELNGPAAPAHKTAPATIHFGWATISLEMWRATKQRTQKMMWVYKLEINIKHFHCAILEQKKKSAFSSNFCFLFDVKSERCVNF